MCKACAGHSFPIDWGVEGEGKGPGEGVGTWHRPEALQFWVAESHGVQIPDPEVLCLLSASLIPRMILTCEVESRLTFQTFYSF